MEHQAQGDMKPLNRVPSTRDHPLEAAGHGACFPFAPHGPPGQPAGGLTPRRMIPPNRTLLTWLALAAAMPGPLLAQGSYNVREFGAVGDGRANDTSAIQKALDTCAVSGGGEVVVPAGRYLIGSIQIGTRTLLRLEKDSVLSGSPDMSAYPLVDVRWEGRWQRGHRGLIYSANVDHTGIAGPGLIEGTPTRDVAPDGTRYPVVIEPVFCSDIRWDGFAVKQGGNWATHPTFCTDVVIRNVRIRGDRDGIDVDSCRNVRIEGCDIDTGDDSISLKSGRGMDGARLGKPCEDILIAHCTLADRNFACLGIGSETSGGVRNVRIEHCRLSPGPRSYGIYIKTRIGRAGTDENIFGDDLDVTAGGFLRINLTRGGNTSTADDPVEGLPGYPAARNIGFSHVRVKCTTLVKADEISAVKPLQGLSLSDIAGTCTSGITLANIRDARLDNISVTGFAGPLLGAVNATGRGLEGAVAIPAPVDPPPGNSPGRPAQASR